MSTSDDRAARTAASLSKSPSRLKSTISTFVPSAGVRLALYQSTTLRIASLSGPGQYTLRTVVGDWPEMCAGMINVTAAQRAKTHPVIVMSRIDIPPCYQFAGKPTWIPGGEIVSDLARQERVRDIPDSDPLLNPRHVQQAGRPGVKPRMVNVVSVRGAAEAPAGGVEVVGDMRDA